MHYRTRVWYKTAFGLGIALVLTVLILSPKAFAQSSTQTIPQSPLAQDVTPTPEDKATVDHSSLSALQGPFATPQDVTKACLSCHDDAAEQIMHTTHWTWEYVNETTGQILGKKNLINNFCIDIQSNEPRCTSCHVGYGWTNESFDFTAQENVDCLVCHDTTGTYKKFPTGAGLPVTEPKEFPLGSGIIWNPPDLANVAQNIGLTSRMTCGTCHFFGGGGDEVKHGDLDSSLVNPSVELDVHMSADGQNFSCTTCHTTEDHQTVGSRYSMDPEQWQGCETCHGEVPHALSSLNQHTAKVACQTCHIPEFARGDIPTKMTWDWSKAGQLTSEGKPVTVKDDSGHVIYDGQKGEFTYAEDVIPEYVWFNGQVQYTLAGDKIDPSGMVSINKFLGSKEDAAAKIWPVKRFEAVQPYDLVNNILVIPHLFGKDESAYWGNYDWDKAITFGMDNAGLPYSGEYGFVTTEMYWPITHMVAPASEALVCKDCHTTDGRLDFAALGYDDANVTRLTKFPPTFSLENLITPQMASDTCLECHTQEHELWTQSSHSDKSVGCVSCHQLEEEGTHPAVFFSMEKSGVTCGACHLKEYDDWKTSVHGQIHVDCSNCHNPHSQQIITVGDNKTACETCHTSQKDDSQHSTHGAAGLTCKECHLNTDLNSGHTFEVGSDTCLKCHADDIHSSGIMINAGVDVGQAPSVEDSPAVAPEPAVTESQSGAGIALPTWFLIMAGIAIGGGLFWLLSTRRLSDAQPEESDEEVEK